MAELKKGVQIEITAKDSTSQGLDSAANKVKDTANKTKNDVKDAVEDIAKSAGKLPGVLGKVQNALGAIGGTAMAVIGAFKIGWDIGTWLNDKVITPLFGIKDPLEEIDKLNRELQRQADEAAAKWQEALGKWAEGWSKAVDGAERAKQAVEDATQAYLRMQDAKERVASAGSDARMLGMERERFEAMAGASTPEEAAALGMYHDVLIAAQKAKQELAKFDRDAEVSAKKQADAEAALRESLNTRVNLKRQLKELDEKIGRYDSQWAADKYGFENANKMVAELRKERSAIETQIADATRDIDRRRGDIFAMRESRSAEAQERENIKERTKLEVDEKKKAYDDYVEHVEQEEARLAAEEWQRQQDAARRAAEEEYRARQKVERELAAQRLADIRREVQESTMAEGDAQRRLMAAQSQVARAWGWYRDKDSLRAQLEEEKADAEAQTQFEKEFDKLKFRRDWREAKNLSLDEEAVRRVALAKEEEDAAQKAALDTAENTRRSADYLQTIESAFREGGV